MKYRASWHEVEASKFSASRQPRSEASPSRTTSLIRATQFELIYRFVLDSLIRINCMRVVVKHECHKVLITPNV